MQGKTAAACYLCIGYLLGPNAYMLTIFTRQIIPVLMEVRTKLIKPFGQKLLTNSWLNRDLSGAGLVQ
jgi:hypothetical protein